MSDKGMGNDSSAELEAARVRIRELEGDLARERTKGDAYAKMLASVPASVIQTDSELKIIFISKFGEGYVPAEVIGRYVFDFAPPEVEQMGRAVMLRVFQTGTSEVMEGVGEMSPDGKTSRFRTYVSALDDSEGHRTLVMMAFDIMGEVSREAALEQSEEQLRLAAEATGLGLWSWDISTGEFRWNSRMHEIFGDASPLNERAFLARVHPEDMPIVQEALVRMRQTNVLEIPPHRVSREDQVLRWMIASGRVIATRDGQSDQLVKRHCVGGTLDVTEQREMQSRLMHAEKMEAVGRLAAGIAHNFNNMLSVMLPTLEKIRRDAKGGPMPVGIEEAHVAGWRAAEMVQQLMTFARGNVDSNVVGAGEGIIDDVVRTALLLARTTFGEDITVEERIDPLGHHLVRGATEIEQAIVNVLVNARDAIRATERPGTISVDLREGRPGETPTHALLTIADTGSGMPSRVARRVFEPFFTTKGSKGTGLGLAMVDTVVRGLGGTVSCQSREGAGSAFTFRIPVEKARTPSPMPRKGDGELVLVVDDEAVFLKTVNAILQEGGYRTAVASSTETASKLLEERSEVALVLLDRTMPGCSPMDLARSIRRERPDIRIVLFSGRELVDEDRDAVDDVLQKPATMSQILDMVRKTLGRERSAAF